MFRCGPHEIAKPSSREIPSARGPRHCGQSSASTHDATRRITITIRIDRDSIACDGELQATGIVSLIFIDPDVPAGPRGSATNDKSLVDAREQVAESHEWRREAVEHPIVEDPPSDARDENPS